MARNSFRLPLFLILGCILCVTPILAESEEALANAQVDGADDDDLTDPAEIAEAQKYLRNYGYFDDDDESTDVQRSASNKQKAIAYMQYKAHIPITGKLNRATLAMMRKPRCGNKDFNGPADRLRRRRKRFSLSGNKWQKRTITYRVQNYTPDLPRGVARNEIQKAFAIWSNSANINFREMPSGQNADIIIRFAYGNHGDGYDFDGQGGVLAHAFFPGRESISGDAHFDEHERFTANSQDGTNLFMVAAHELGHSLGLGHSDVESSMMAPIYQGYTHGFRLHRDDVMGIQRLYGAGPQRPDRPGVRPNPPVEPPSRPRPPTTPTCDIRVNAIMALSANDMLAYSGDQYWRLRSSDGHTFSIASTRYPRKISAHYKLPGRIQLTNIDAAYQRTDGVHRIFKGSEYFDFNPNGEMMERGQNTIASLFRRQMKRNAPPRFDAAVKVPQANNRVYLFRGQQYWRLNDENNRIDFGYPLPLSKWSRELTTGVDATFYAAGSVFFVQGNSYRQYDWEANELLPQTNGQSPRIDRQFFGCGLLQDGTLTQPGNGQSSTRTASSWVLLSSMIMASVVYHVMLL